MPLGLRLASAAASAHPSVGVLDGRESTSVLWRFPALPIALSESVAADWNVTITADRDAVDPRTLPGFAALHAHARSEQVIRALARQTNLVLPAASALVIGADTLADTLAGTLGRGGTRVTRVIGDPVVRLRAQLDGVDALESAGPNSADSDTALPATDLVIATGEGHPAIDPAALSGVVIDASSDRTALLAAEGDPVRRGVQRIAERTWIVESPDPFLSTASAHPTRIADLLIALSILRAGTAGAADDAARTADTRLARLVLA